MNVVFQNPYYQVLEYPEFNAIELVDIARASGMLIRGAMADAFRASLALAMAVEPTEEAMETFIGGYEALMNLPVSYH